MRFTWKAIPALALAAFSSLASSAITNAQAEKIASLAIGRFKASGSVEKIEASKVESNSFTYRIWFKGKPTLEQITSDTKGLVRETLRELKINGLDTSQNPVFIHAHAYKKVQGETRDMVRVYGKATYNFNSDSIEFKLEK